MTLLSTVKEFIDTIASGVKVKMSDNFAFSWETDTIYIYKDARDEFGFVRNLKTAHNFTTDISYFTLAVLHELGHFFTMDSIDESDNDVYNWVIASVISKDVAKLSEEVQDMYYSITAEYSATEWGINFIKDNYDFVKAYDETFQKYLY